MKKAETSGKSSIVCLTLPVILRERKGCFDLHLETKTEEKTAINCCDWYYPNRLIETKFYEVDINIIFKNKF